MAQAGIHALVGAAFRTKFFAKEAGSEWLMVGILIGSVFPDLDNYAVAAATLTESTAEGLHRTATHSLITTAAIMCIFWLIGQAKKDARWLQFGMGAGAGILLHIGLDLVLWFNGVELFWPIPAWVNLWEKTVIPGWFFRIMEGFELFFFAAFFAWLAREMRQAGANDRPLRIWAGIALALWIVFTLLLVQQTGGIVFTLYGLTYLIFLTSMVIAVFRYRKIFARGRVS